MRAAEYGERLPIDQKIEAAANWLDDTYPGWADRIVREDFNISLCDHCVGAALGRNWEDLRIQFMIETNIHPEGVFSCGQTFWLEQIDKRQGEV